MDEALLIKNARQGDQSALELLFNIHIDYAIHLAYLITRNRETAQDAAQESFVRAFRSLSSFQDDKPFKPWLTRIVVNQSKTAIKRASQHLPLSEAHALASEGNTPEETFFKQERKRRIMGEINKLNDKHRIPLLLKYYAELSEMEISSVLKVPLSTVKSRLYIGRQKLKDKLRED